jgi:WD40 repeat protein
MVGPEQPLEPQGHSATRVDGGESIRHISAGLLGRSVGPYRVRRRLGGGGMGTVYEAFDERLQRPVALKVLTEALANSEQARARFLVEARAAARLNHPNVVTVFEVGEATGLSFLVMELIPGGSVQERVRAAGHLHWLEATRMLADACRGVAAAHRAGLVHRDIKPGNLMLTGEGTVKVADFGLARPADRAGPGLTGDGAILGTPDYMSPEQCQGDRAGPLSDVYSLGATYYYLLTGRQPYKGEAAMQVMFAHCSSPPPDPRSVCPNVPEGCANVVRRAMAKQRGDRYPDAAALLADLEALLAVPSDDTPMLPSPPACPSPPSRRDWLWAAGAVGLAGAGAFAAWMYFRGGKEEVPVPGPDSDGPGQEGPPPEWPLTLKERKRLPGHKGRVAIVRYSPDGRYLVTAGDGTAVRLWKMPSGDPFHTLEGHDRIALCATFAPDRRTLATGGTPQEVCFWDIASGKKLQTHRGRQNIHDLAFSPDGRFLVGAADLSGLVIWKRKGRDGLEEWKLLSPGSGGTRALAVSPDGKSLAEATLFNAVRLRDWANFGVLATRPGKPLSVSFAPDGSRLAVGTVEEAMVWTPGGEAVTFTTGTHRTSAVAWSPNGKTVAYSHEAPGGPIFLWHQPTGETLQFPHGDGGVASLGFSADGRTLVSGGVKGTVTLWDVLPGSR